MPYEVDRTSSVPIYMQLAGWLESKITTGEWQNDFKLAGEVDLAKNLGVSRGSLRKAISLLISKNLLVQVHGKGTFVSTTILEQSWAGSLGVYEELMLKGIPFTTEVLEKGIIFSQEQEARLLGINLGDPVFYLKRLRRVTQSPIVLHESYFPASRFGDLINVDFTQGSMVETIEKRYGIHLAWAAHTIAVVRSSASAAAALSIKVGDPLLYNEHVMYDDQDNKVELTKGYFRSDRIRMRTVVRRGQNENPAIPLEGKFNANGNFHNLSIKGE